MISQDQLNQFRSQLSDLETQLSDPATATDQYKLKRLMSEHRRIKLILEKADAYFSVLQEKKDNQSMIDDAEMDEELREMAVAEVEELDQRLPGLEKILMVSLLPPDPADNRNIIIEIRAGTGGDEAALFAADLQRMYSRLAEQRGWSTSVMDANPSSIGGFKEIVFSIEGQDVFRQLRYESGVHRVQRVPATEASGRIHTSAATVAVLPEADDLDEIDIKTEDLRVDTFRASGAGGQHVNTTDSAIRITHEPTGIVVQSQDERSQHRNKEKAMRVLKAKLLDNQREEEARKAASERKSQIGTGDRSERIRTYNYPQNRVTDHRINLTLYNLDRMMEGDLDEMLNTLYDNDIEERIAALFKPDED